MKENIWYLSARQYIVGLDTKMPNFFVFSVGTTGQGGYLLWISISANDQAVNLGSGPIIHIRPDALAFLWRPDYEIHLLLSIFSVPTTILGCPPGVAKDPAKWILQQHKGCHRTDVLLYCVWKLYHGENRYHYTLVRSKIIVTYK